MDNEAPGPHPSLHPRWASFILRAMLSLLLSLATMAPIQDGDSFWDKFEGYGDFRLRHESTLNHLSDTSDPEDGFLNDASNRHRERVRVRQGRAP